MRIAIIGGGPGGLFAAALFRSADPAAQVTVFERNRPRDTFGFGVVFSDATLHRIDDVDPVLLQALRDHGLHWDAIEVRVHGERWRCGGNGMAAIARARLLTLLHDAARDAGVELFFQTEVTDIGALSEEYDLVIGADGANSAVRRWLGDDVGLTVDVASAKFIWLATTKLFDGLTFLHHRGPDGVFAVHGYPFSDEASTFIVETDEASWRRAGLDSFDVTQPPGPSDMKSKEYLEGLFAEHLDGHPLLVNNSRWANFRTIRCDRWWKGNAVIIGDAAHTAHFSVGSGTKMAMEDAAALVAAVTEHDGDLAAALPAYEAVRRPAVGKIQGAARPSLSWWEHFGRYHDHLAAPQFAFHFFSRAIRREKLAQRDPGFVADVEAWWDAEHGRPPLATPLDVGDLALSGRVVSVEGAGAEGGGVARVAGAGGPYQTIALAPPGSSVPGAAWGLWLEAPGDEAGIPAAVAEMERGLAAGAALVAVHGGTPVTRVLLCEEARLLRKTPALLVDDTLSADEAATLILSGRADLVGAAPTVAETWSDR